MKLYYMYMYIYVSLHQASLKPLSDNPLLTQPLPNPPPTSQQPDVYERAYVYTYTYIILFITYCMQA
jgi:hypothetical protein